MKRLYIFSFAISLGMISGDLSATALGHWSWPIYVSSQVVIAVIICLVSRKQ